MTAVQEDNVGSGWRKLFALLLVVLAIGLPINNISDYVLLAILAVVICWRGTIMWEGEGERFVPLTGNDGRAINSADVNRRIFGVAIKPDTLSMQLNPPPGVSLLNFGRGIVVLEQSFGLIATLVRFKARHTILPFVLIGLAVVIIVADDASFFGGLRPLDGGYDGLY